MSPTASSNRLFSRFPLMIVAGVMIFLTSGAALFAAENNRQSHIILVMADDLGWMDLHCQGNGVLRTPRIDQLAKQGVRFTNAYAAAPVCSPTRAALITGLAPARLHITQHGADGK